ncbi:MAG: hypothetical protein F4045_12355 [Chloroflexi bacterium]|nr:hypothetical protein [Chloroflexota bacterium]MYK35855.1 hypothetical protein [Chloroflexota bacterium]
MAEDFTRYRNDPVGFVRDVLGEAGMPYSKQVEMLEAMVDHRRVSVVGANASGKDWTAARAVLWWMETQEDPKTVVTGPTQRQVEDVVWQEMREAYAVAPERLGGKMLASKYRIDENRFAIGFSTNKACNIQGFHAQNLLVVVTEAHAMPQDQMDAIKRLHPKRLLLLGNAMSLDGEFHDSHHAKQHIYRRIRISAYDTPNFTGEDGGVPGTITPEDAEELALDWSEDHPFYASAVLAEFPDAQEDSLVGREAVEAAMQRGEAAAVVPAEAGTSPFASSGLRDSRLRGNDDDHLSPGERSARDSAAGEGEAAGSDCHFERSAAESRNLSGESPAQHERSPRDASTAPPALLSMTMLDPNLPVYVGVDVGRFGFDKSAICVRQGERVFDLRSFAKMDTMRLVHEVQQTLRTWGAEAVFVDEGGVGGGVVDRLRELGEPVYGVHFGGRAPHRTRFYNMRSEFFWELRMLLNDGLLALPRDEELAGQLISLRYDVSSSGQVRLQGKREMRKRGLPSPDKADALALAFLVPPSFGIWTGTEPFLNDDRASPDRVSLGYRLPPPGDDNEDDPPRARSLGVWFGPPR